MFFIRFGLFYFIAFLLKIRKLSGCKAMPDYACLKTTFQQLVLKTLQAFCLNKLYL